LIFDKRVFYNTPWIIWCVLILYLLLMPKSTIPAFKFTFPLPIPIDKMVHFSLFFILTGLIFWAKIKIQGLIINLRFIVFCFIAISVFGILTEALQHFATSTRQASFLDWIADFLGTSVAFIYILVFSRKIIIVR